MSLLVVLWVLLRSSKSTVMLLHDDFHTLAGWSTIYTTITNSTNCPNNGKCARIAGAGQMIRTVETNQQCNNLSLSFKMLYNVASSHSAGVWYYCTNNSSDLSDVSSKVVKLFEYTNNSLYNADLIIPNVCDNKKYIIIKYNVVAPNYESNNAVYISDFGLIGDGISCKNNDIMVELLDNDSEEDFNMWKKYLAWLVISNSSNGGNCPNDNECIEISNGGYVSRSIKISSCFSIGLYFDFDIIGIGSDSFKVYYGCGTPTSGEEKLWNLIDVYPYSYSSYYNESVGTGCSFDSFINIKFEFVSNFGDDKVYLDNIRMNGYGSECHGSPLTPLPTPSPSFPTPAPTVPVLMNNFNGNITGYNILNVNSVNSNLCPDMDVSCIKFPYLSNGYLWNSVYTSGICKHISIIFDVNIVNTYFDAFSFEYICSSHPLTNPTSWWHGYTFAGGNFTKIGVYKDVESHIPNNYCTQQNNPFINIRFFIENNNNNNNNNNESGVYLGQFKLLSNTGVNCHTGGVWSLSPTKLPSLPSYLPTSYPTLPSIPTTLRPTPVHSSFRPTRNDDGLIDINFTTWEIVGIIALACICIACWIGNLMWRFGWNPFLCKKRNNNNNNNTNENLLNDNDNNEAGKDAEQPQFVPVIANDNDNN